MTIFFLSFYWINNREKKREERIKIQCEYERELSQKLFKNDCSNIIALKVNNFFFRKEKRKNKIFRIFFLLSSLVAKIHFFQGE